MSTGENIEDEDVPCCSKFQPKNSSLKKLSRHASDCEEMIFSLDNLQTLYNERKKQLKTFNGILSSKSDTISKPVPTMKKTPMVSQSPAESGKGEFLAVPESSRERSGSFSPGIQGSRVEDQLKDQIIKNFLELGKADWNGDTFERLRRHNFIMWTKEREILNQESQKASKHITPKVIDTVQLKKPSVSLAASNLLNVPSVSCPGIVKLGLQESDKHLRIPRQRNHSASSTGESTSKLQRILEKMRPNKKKIKPPASAHHVRIQQKWKSLGRRGREQAKKYETELQEQIREMQETKEKWQESLVEKLKVAVENASKTRDDLVVHRLCDWKLRQQIADIAPMQFQDNLQRELDKFDQEFEEFGNSLKKLQRVAEKLDKCLTGSFRKEEECGKALLPYKTKRSINQINSLISRFAWDSCVVSVQPPPILIKSDAASSMDHTNLRTPEIRLLGGSSLGFRASNRAEITAKLITKEQAENQRADKLNLIGRLVHNEAKFYLEKETGKYAARFERSLMLTDFTQKGHDERYKGYYILFLINMTGGPMVIQGMKLSNPITVFESSIPYLERNTGAKDLWHAARIRDQHMMERSPEEGKVSWSSLSLSLSLKFQQILETGNQGLNRQLSVQDLEHFARRLLVTTNQEWVTWDRFGNAALCFEGPSSFTFYEWFLNVASLINKHLLPYWNAYLIHGFISKIEAEELVVKAAIPNMLIKFSDGTYGSLTITHFDPGNMRSAVHFRIPQSEIEAEDFVPCIRSSPELRNVSSIWPDRVAAELTALRRQSMSNKSLLDSVHGVNPTSDRKSVTNRNISVLRGGTKSIVSIRKKSGRPKVPRQLAVMDDIPDILKLSIISSSSDSTAGGQSSEWTTLDDNVSTLSSESPSSLSHEVEDKKLDCQGAEILHGMKQSLSPKQSLSFFATPDQDSVFF